MDYIFVRAACSFLVGVLLSQSGTLMQLGTRNILASPSTLGFDGLAILWFLIIHSLALFTSQQSDFFWILAGVPVFIGIGWLFPRFLSGKTKFERLILLGLTFNLLVGAVFSLWQFLFLAFNLQFPAELWFGHFRFASGIALVMLIVAQVFILFGLRKNFQSLMLFSLGPQISRNYGLNVKKLFRFIFVTVALSTFLTVNLFGAFSFLGLIFPIIGRRLWFRRYDLKGELFLGGPINGAALSLLDFLCYQFPFYGAEVPVGLIVTGIGALSLIALLWLDHKDSEILAKPFK